MPITAVKIIIGALIIKHLFDYSDDKLVIYLTKHSPEQVSELLKHYADSNDYNYIFYHQRNGDMENTIQMLLTDNDYLLKICKTDYEEVTEYQLFVENGKRRLRTKEDGTLNSSALQNSSDPDATYRNKSSKMYQDYVTNLEETVCKTAQ